MTAISVIPRTTEKAYKSSLATNTYIFTVPLDANKQEIVASIEAQFAVKVDRIKTLVQNGKAIRFSRGKRAHPGKTTRTDIKKAYVTLAKGNSLHIFDAPAKEEKK